MKENVLEVLMYLFENHMKDNCNMQQSQNVLVGELTQAGFHSDEIHKAFDWLEGLAKFQDNTKTLDAASDKSFRIFTPYESSRLDVACRGFLTFLEQIKILNPITREYVIDRITGLEATHIELYHVKWVTLMVLFNQPGEEAALACMEYLVLEDMLGGTH